MTVLQKKTDIVLNLKKGETESMLSETLKSLNSNSRDITYSR